MRGRFSALGMENFGVNDQPCEIPFPNCRGYFW